VTEFKKKATHPGSAGVVDTPAGRIFTPPPSNAPLLSEYMTEDELAAELRRTKRTIVRWRALGVGPKAIRLGRQWLYRRESVRDWLAGLERDA
jgi:hypothetical protein